MEKEWIRERRGLGEGGKRTFPFQGSVGKSHRE